MTAKIIDVKSELLNMKNEPLVEQMQQKSSPDIGESFNMYHLMVVLAIVAIIVIIWLLFREKISGEKQTDGKSREVKRKSVRFEDTKTVTKKPAKKQVEEDEEEIQDNVDKKEEERQPNDDDFSEENMQESNEELAKESNKKTLNDIDKAIADLEKQGNN